MRFVLMSFFNFCFFFVFCNGGQKILATNPNWWKSTIFYQIIVPSFRDSNNDGIGDFKGAKQGLSYLKDLGVGTVWLSSFHKSTPPLTDFAVIDFKSVHPQFGTLADFQDFIAEAKSLGMNVIMDFIPNHSGTSHDWFVKSVRKQAPYTDYYIWKPSLSNNVSAPVPPCKWQSALGEPAWSWNEQRGEYYYHAYHKETADLNLRNNDVKKELKDILQFWMSLGVKGFVIETVSYLFEDEKCLDDTAADKKQSSTLNQKENLPLLKEWRKFIDEYLSKDPKTPGFLMVRVEPFEEIDADYYGDEKEPGAHIVSNPALLKKTETINSAELDITIGKALKQMLLKAPPLWVNWAVGGSRITRVANRLGKELIDGANMLMLMLPGTPITYYGEEIGMEAFHKIPTAYTAIDSYARDRTPFQWCDHPNAGFTESHATDTYLPVNSNYFRINVESEKEDTKSHLNNYKRVAKLRNQPEMLTADVSTFLMNANVYALVRETSTDKKYIVLVNFAENSPCINFKQNILDIKDPYLFVHSASENSEYNINERVNIDNCFMMRPKSSLLLTTSSSSILRITLGILMLPIYLSCRAA
nr:PREDICTED: maltase 1-like [Bemisia tabaci]